MAFGSSNKTIGQIKEEIYKLAAVNANEYSTWLDQWIIDCYRDVETKYDFSFLHKTGSVDLVTDTSTYNLPADFHKFTTRAEVRDDTNKSPILPMRFAESDITYGSLSTTTASQLSHFHVSVQPRYIETELSANSAITVVSDSASDTAVNVYLEGIDTSGDVLIETPTLNGTSGVTGSGTFASGGLYKATKTDLTVGTITIKDASANVLCKLLPRVRSLECRRLVFTPAPNSDLDGETINFSYISKIEDPKNEDDICIFRNPKVLKHFLLENVFFSQGHTTKSKEQKEMYIESVGDLISEDNRYYVGDHVSNFERYG